MKRDELLKESYKTFTILCVEDDSTILSMYKQIFPIIFKETFFAENGEEGFECFEKEKIDIVLTDYMMPKCNGLEMSKKIREEDTSVPIIMVTALESIDILREALDVNITSFLRKPFTKTSLFNVFNVAVKSVLADRLMLKQQQHKIQYSTYQESLTFEKEKTIAKNEYEKGKVFGDFTCKLIYKPLDILSGDSFCLKEIENEGHFLFLVDGMGKGISASTTAMLCSAFVNYYVSHRYKSGTAFRLEPLIEELLLFIKSNLLDEEVVSAHFLFFDEKCARMHYSVFSMPPVLYLQEGKNESSLKIRSNNPPMASYTETFKVDSVDISSCQKMIVYTDGLNENSLRNKEELYTTQLKEDFMQAKSQEAFEKLVQKHTQEQEDDITYVWLMRGQEDV